jgi:hypothetical protein
VRLRVNGQTYTRTARVLRDPRIAASDADLVAQYDLARRVDALRSQVKSARAKAQDAAKNLSGEQLRIVQAEVIGEEPAANPDDSVGSYSQDLTSFLFLEGALDNLEAAIESADAPPTPDMSAAYAKLSGIYRTTLGRLNAATGGHGE